MMGHVTSPAYVSGFEAKRTLVAKCALLVAHLLVNERFDFTNGRWAGSATQLSTVSSASLNGRAFTWLNGMKAVNPQAYFYLYRAVRLLVDVRLI